MQIMQIQQITILYADNGETGKRGDTADYGVGDRTDTQDTADYGARPPLGVGV